MQSALIEKDAEAVKIMDILEQFYTTRIRLFEACYGKKYDELGPEIWCTIPQDLYSCLRNVAPYCEQDQHKFASFVVWEIANAIPYRLVEKAVEHKNEFLQMKDLLSNQKFFTSDFREFVKRLLNDQDYALKLQTACKFLNELSAYIALNGLTNLSHSDIIRFCDRNDRRLLLATV